ncbi:MAG: hypothetical protein ACRYG5_06275 [Janthinobacterium lividum]
MNEASGVASEDDQVEREDIDVHLRWRGFDATLRMPARLPLAFCASLLPTCDTADFAGWPTSLRALFIERGIQWLLRWIQMQTFSNEIGGLVLTRIAGCGDRQKSSAATGLDDGGEYAGERLVVTLSNDSDDYHCVLQALPAMLELLAAALKPLQCPQRVDAPPLSASVPLAGRLIRRCANIGIDDLRSLREGDVILYRGTLNPLESCGSDEALPDVAELAFDEDGDGILPTIVIQRGAADAYQVVDCHWSEPSTERDRDKEVLSGAFRMQASIAAASVDMTIGALRELTVDAGFAPLAASTDSACLLVAGQPVAVGRLVRIGNRGGLLVMRTLPQ